MIIIKFDNITITANKEKKILTIKVPYDKVISYTAKKNKEVFANLYMKKLGKNNEYTLDLQLYGKIVKEAVEVITEEEGIDL